jgi:hypothetical protein
MMSDDPPALCCFQPTPRIPLSGRETVLAVVVPTAQFIRLRQKLKKYQDPYVAVRDLYLSTVGCVRYSGELQSVLHIK